MDLPVDILFEILGYLDFLSKIRFIQITKYFIQNLYIEDFYNIGQNYLSRLPDQLISLNPNIKYLDISENNLVRNINNLTNLKKLNISDLYPKKIQNFGLQILKIQSLSEFNNLRYFTGLTKLDIYNSNIHADFKNLNLTKLKIQQKSQKRSYKLNCLTKLTKLELKYIKIFESKLDLNLTELNITGVAGLTYLNNLTNLKKLTISSIFTIFDLSKLDLQEINIFNNKSNFSHMTNLLSLNIDYISDINFLHKFKKLKILNCCNSNILEIPDLDLIYLNITGTQITNINHLTSLKYLYANYSWITHIPEADLLELEIDRTNITKIKSNTLKYLSAWNTPKLKKISADNLTKLIISGVCPIADLNNLTSLKKLSISQPNNITKSTTYYNLAISNSSIQNLNLLELDNNYIYYGFDKNNIKKFKKISAEILSEI